MFIKTNDISKLWSKMYSGGAKHLAAAFVGDAKVSPESKAEKVSPTPTSTRQPNTRPFFYDGVTYEVEYRKITFEEIQKLESDPLVFFHVTDHPITIGRLSTYPDGDEEYRVYFISDEKSYDGDRPEDYPEEYGRYSYSITEERYYFDNHVSIYRVKGVLDETTGQTSDVVEIDGVRYRLGKYLDFSEVCALAPDTVVYFQARDKSPVIGKIIKEKYKGKESTFIATDDKQYDGTGPDRHIHLYTWLIFSNSHFLGDLTVVRLAEKI